MVQLPKVPPLAPTSDPESKNFHFEVAREWRMKHVSRWSDEVLLQQRADAISMKKHHADAPFRFNAVTALISGLGGIAIERLVKALKVFEKLPKGRKALAEDAAMLSAGVGTAYLWGSYQKRIDDRRVELEAGLELERYNDELEARTGVSTEILDEKKITLEDLIRLRQEHGKRSHTEKVAEITGDPTVDKAPKR